MIKYQYAYLNYFYFMENIIKEFNLNNMEPDQLQDAAQSSNQIAIPKVNELAIPKTNELTIPFSLNKSTIEFFILEVSKKSPQMFLKT